MDTKTIFELNKQKETPCQGHKACVSSMAKKETKKPKSSKKEVLQLIHYNYL